MEEVAKDNVALFKNKVLDAFKYLLSSSGYWWRLSVTAILLINTMAMVHFIVFANPEYATVQGWATFLLIVRVLLFILIVSFVGQALYKIYYSYLGNKYKKLGGEEA